MAVILSREKLKIIAGLILLIILLWMGFAPVQLGGSVSYVIISGNSMEPQFDLGDLVLARKRSSYQVGQVVVYRHPNVGFVFHRIVGRSKDQYILKGDNNDWVDSYAPNAEDVLGAYWFGIPKAGNLIGILRRPVYFSALVAILAGLTFYLFFFQDDRNLHQRNHGTRFDMNADNPNKSGDFRQDLLLILGLLALAALLMGIVVFTRPLVMEVDDNLPYTHASEFTYSTSVNPWDLYDPSGISTGDPVYPALTCIINLDYSYHLKSLGISPEDQSTLSGTLGLSAVLSDQDGWTRIFDLVTDQPFSGPAAETRAWLDICQILEVVDQKELITGTESRWYDLDIVPEVRISGTLAGIPINDNYQPRIQFQLNKTVFRVSEFRDAEQLNEERLLSRTKEVDNFLTIFGRGLRIRTARQIVAVAFGIFLLLAVYPAMSLIKDYRRSEAARIQIESQPLLVTVKKGSLKKRGQQVIEVASFQDLKKLAERYGAMILHEADDRTHNYYLQDQDTVFQFSAVDPIETPVQPGAVDQAKKTGSTKTKTKTKAQDKADKE